MLLPMLLAATEGRLVHGRLPSRCRCRLCCAAAICGTAAAGSRVLADDQPQRALLQEGAGRCKEQAAVPKAHDDHAKALHMLPAHLAQRASARHPCSSMRDALCG